MNEKLESIRLALKDVLWNLRRQYGLEKDIDAFLPYLAFNDSYGSNRFDQLCRTYPRHLPYDKRTVLAALIQQAMRAYHRYQQTIRGRTTTLKRLRELQTIASHGLDAIDLKPDAVVGHKFEFPK